MVRELGYAEIHGGLPPTVRSPLSQTPFHFTNCNSFFLILYSFSANIIKKQEILYLFSRPVEKWAKVSYLSKCRTLFSPGEIAPVLIAWNAVK